MDTYMTLTAYGKNAKKALDEAVDEINNIEQLVSTGIDSSEVSQINKNGKGSVSETTGYLIKRSKEIYDSTNGVFDITIYPIMQAYTRLFIIIKAKRQDGSPLREDSVKELYAIGRRRAAHAVKTT